MVRMRDGVHLACDSTARPRATRSPPLVQRQPYDKRVAQTYVYDHPAVYARHGYAVVIEDTRGRFASEGEFYPLRLDAEDGYDTIEWCAAQPWCNGRVGSFGFSHPRREPAARRRRAAPATSPLPCLASIPGGMYEGFTHVGGTFGLAAVMDWALIISGEAARRRGDKEVLGAIGAAQAAGGRWPAALSLRDIPFLEDAGPAPLPQGLRGPPGPWRLLGRMGDRAPARADRRAVLPRERLVRQLHLPDHRGFTRR